MCSSGQRNCPSMPRAAGRPCSFAWSNRSAPQDPRTLMEILGHSQFGITMDLYAHVLPHKLDDAAQRVETLLGGTADGDAEPPPAGTSGQDGGQTPGRGGDTMDELTEFPKELVVSQNFASWNQLDGWLRQLEGLRRTA
jgi:hypothetical protein